VPPEESFRARVTPRVRIGLPWFPLLDCKNVSGAYSTIPAVVGTLPAMPALQPTSLLGSAPVVSRKRFPIAHAYVPRLVSVAVMLASSIGLAEERESLGWARNQVTPDTNRVEQLKREFLSLKRPIDVGTFVEKPSTSLVIGNSIAYVTIGGDGKKFLEKATVKEVVYALWPFLDGVEHDADAALMLLCKLHVRISAGYELTQDSQSAKRSWPRERTGIVRVCKRSSQFALAEPDWWYPHNVLFDLTVVLEESRTNPVVRAGYIAAMQKALEDPKIRLENPLGVDETLVTLSFLNATEAAKTMVDYMFFDRSTGSDYRIPEDGTTNGFWDPNKPHNLGLPCNRDLPRLGEACVPYVLARIADSSETERSTRVGGGAQTILPMFYFIAVGFSEEQAVAAIARFKQEHKELTNVQLGALNELVEVIEKKKFRPDGFRGCRERVPASWAVPVSTNDVPGK
jgi:hypothetical protein